MFCRRVDKSKRNVQKYKLHVFILIDSIYKYVFLQGDMNMRRETKCNGAQIILIGK